jgi:hypothetical protein
MRPTFTDSGVKSRASSISPKLRHMNVPFNAIYPLKGARAPHNFAHYFPPQLETLAITSPSMGCAIKDFLTEIVENRASIPYLTTVQIYATKIWCKHDGVKFRRCVKRTAAVRADLDKIGIEVLMLLDAKVPGELVNCDTEDADDRGTV